MLDFDILEDKIMAYKSRYTEEQYKEAKNKLVVVEFKDSKKREVIKWIRFEPELHLACYEVTREELDKYGAESVAVLQKDKKAKKTTETKGKVGEAAAKSTKEGNLKDVA